MEDQLPKFLLKTYMMVEDPTTDGIVSWNIHGNGFVVWRLAEFARDLLPAVFKHSNFASFVRQLNTYEFHKVSPDRWEFENKFFCKGAIDQLHLISRKKPTPNKRQCDPQHSKKLSRSQSDDNERRHLSSSSMQYTILIGENERLQLEKEALSFELSAMKTRFDKLLDLASTYNQNL